MPAIPLRKELKEKFIQDLTPSEKIFFLKKAQESIMLKGYLACEDLFHCCYFLTLKERFSRISPQRAEGCLRFLLVEGAKDIEEAIKLYEERLKNKKIHRSDTKGYEFIEHFFE